MSTVILADPDAQRRSADRFVLETGGASVVEVDSLADALAAVAAAAPDAVVIAVELCDAISPARLAAALRAQPETASLRLVLVSEPTADVDAEGSDALLRRPTWPLDLVAAALA